MYEYSEIRRVTYGDEGATFVPVCSKCHRFVKAPETTLLIWMGSMPSEMENYLMVISILSLIGLVRRLFFSGLTVRKNSHII